MSGEEESLIATRKRRSNAGSRLKQLLQAEEVSAEVNSDDDDLDLLFQEDENDDEFNVEEEEEHEEEEEEEQASDGEQSGVEEEEAGTTEGDDEKTTKETTAERSSDEDSPEAYNEDEMFSDSSSSEDEEDDDDAGEKELQKQERIKKRQAAKKVKAIPKITTRPQIKAVKKKTVIPKADTLLSASRRQSSRKAAIQNKLDLVSKLKEDEIRRKSLKPVSKIEYVEMTQEERLAEAVETEKMNLLTLNKYQEQEVERKQKQRALQLSRRKKLENIMSFKSLAKFVTPVEEHEFEKYLLKREQLMRKKRDKRGRKSEKQKREEEEARRQEEARQRRASLFVIMPKEAQAIRNEQLGIKDADTESKGEPSSPIEVKVESENDKDVLELAPEQIPQETNTASPKRPFSEEDEDDHIEKKLKLEAGSSDNQENATITEDLVEEGESVEVGTGAPKDDSAVTEIIGDPQAEDSMDDKDKTPENQVAKEDSTSENKNIKTVKFTDDDETMEFASNEDLKANLSDDEEKFVELGSSRETTADPEVFFEGPPQKVTANYISFEENRKKMPLNEIRAILFGSQVLLPAQRKSKEVEPLVRIKVESSLGNDQESSKDDLPDFGVFDNLPKFGEFNKVKKEQVVLETREDIKVVLKTRPPTGIYLANGSKKICFITGKPAMYFDPNTGLPYGSVEAYKVIKDIHNGQYAWVEFPGGGSYVCNREHPIHAKGVPEGFDD